MVYLFVRAILHFLCLFSYFGCVLFAYCIGFVSSNQSFGHFLYDLIERFFIASWTKIEDIQCKKKQHTEERKREIAQFNGLTYIGQVPNESLHSSECAERWTSVHNTSLSLSSQSVRGIDNEETKKLSSQAHTFDTQNQINQRSDYSIKIYLFMHHIYERINGVAISIRQMLLNVSQIF